MVVQRDDEKVGCFSAAQNEAIGTNRTNRAGLTMSVLEGKADFPVAHPRLLSLTQLGRDDPGVFLLRRAG